MLGSKKRDYTTEHRATKKRLKLHWNRMLELEKKGYSRQEASKIAYKELLKGKLK